MTLGKWATLIDEDSHDNAKENVHSALQLGMEKYARVIGNLSEDLSLSREMDALLSALIVGNLAFDAQAGCVIALGGTGFQITLMLEEAE
jgi:hypothetical protein